VYSGALFQGAVKAIEANGAYSQRDDSWTIAVPHLQKILEDLLRHESRASLPSYALILEEGERRGFWKVNYDHDYVADLVVMKLLIDSQ
jgi:hypothetical protein